MNLKNLVVAAATAVGSVAAFAADPVDPAAAVTAQITSNFASAGSIVTAVGLALVGLGFLAFILRKGQQASKGQIK